MDGKGWRLEAGGGRRETGGWRLEVEEKGKAAAWPPQSIGRVGGWKRISFAGGLW